MPKSRVRHPKEHRPEQRRQAPDFDPVVGGLHDGEDVALIVAERDGLRDAVMLPRSLERLSGDQVYWVKALQRNAFDSEALRQKRELLVLHARGDGVSWSAIGWSLGVTGEAARQRWGSDMPLPRGHDGR